MAAAAAAVTPLETLTAVAAVLWRLPEPLAAAAMARALRTQVVVATTVSLTMPAVAAVIGGPDELTLVMVPTA